ncbi:MAG TPA: hypothetical protein VF510_12430 [Ktedonobacterales bacterium]
MNQPNEPARQEPVRVEFRYATTPEERARFEKMQKRTFGMMGGMLIMFLIFFLLFVAFVAILGYVFLHNALHLF